jgi:tRNA(Ile2)-agmatinylcytidine synthase
MTFQGIYQLSPVYKQDFWIGIDDTDSPEGMCTTWLGALLIRRLRESGNQVIEARLIRLNPTIPYRTRGNAAIAIRCRGNPYQSFDLACSLVSSHADLTCEKTHPGVVVCDHQPPVSFYLKAVTAICTIQEAEDILKEHALAWKGYKLGRGLIGATAAVSSRLADSTWELLVYRESARLGTCREIDEESFYLSEEITTPHTWDTVDVINKTVVCVPHTPDPVLFGIRGDTPFAVAKAVSCIRSEPGACKQIWLTNQGTDAHLIEAEIGALKEGCSYRVRGTVNYPPVTGRGGHVSILISDGTNPLTCMAFEPTKQFRHQVRLLVPGDRIIAAGSIVKGVLNMEKFCLLTSFPEVREQAPVCQICQKRMTSAGAGKGYKCRKCGSRSGSPEIIQVPRTISPGWYEVPPSARRHLARPLIRGPGNDI